MITFSFLDLKKHLTEAWNNGTINHAYCISGPKGVGKQLLIEKCMEQWFPNKATAVGSVFTISPLEGKKDIAIEQVRSIRSLLVGGSLFSSKRIIIIKPADKMSAAAANGLLKILEEAPRDTTFFLLADTWQNLPQTILSRCQRFSLSPSTKEMMAEVLQIGIEEDVVRNNFGLLGNAHMQLNDPELLLQHQEDSDLLYQLFATPIHLQREKIKPFLGDKKDHTAQRRRIAQLFNTWQCCTGNVMEQLVRPESQDDNFSYVQEKGVTTKQLVETQRVLTQANHDIMHNIHPKLIFENIMITLYGKQ